MVIIISYRSSSEQCSRSANAWKSSENRPIPQSSTKLVAQKRCRFLVGYKLAEKWNSFKLKGLLILSPAFRCYRLLAVVDYFFAPLQRFLCALNGRWGMPESIRLDGAKIWYLEPVPKAPFFHYDRCESVEQFDALNWRSKPLSYCIQ